MPNPNFAQLRKKTIATTRIKHAQKQEQAKHFNFSSFEMSPVDVSEPHASTDFLDIPCTPVTTTTPAAAEPFETPAATPSN